MTWSSFTFLAITVVAYIQVSSAVDYCKIKSCGGRQTACIYKSAGHSTRCTGFQGSGLSDDEKKRIVNLHNQLRQTVAQGKEKYGRPGPQPAAKQMPNLSWDNELELIAQRWANQCNWGHDQCRNVERFSVGQNIASSGTNGNVESIEVENMVHSWYNEVKDFDRNEVPRFTGKNFLRVGHYTQMVWAKTTKIGCGAVKYKEGQFNKYYLVCNYGPTGNFINQPIYERR